MVFVGILPLIWSQFWQDFYIGFRPILVRFLSNFSPNFGSFCWDFIIDLKPILAGFSHRIQPNFWCSSFLKFVEEFTTNFGRILSSFLLEFIEEFTTNLKPILAGFCERVSIFEFFREIHHQFLAGFCHQFQSNFGRFLLKFLTNFFLEHLTIDLKPILARFYYRYHSNFWCAKFLVYFTIDFMPIFWWLLQEFIWISKPISRRRF